MCDVCAYFLHQLQKLYKITSTVVNFTASSVQDETHYSYRMKKVKN